jgi:hypothetical protein
MGSRGSGESSSSLVDGGGALRASGAVELGFGGGRGGTSSDAVVVGAAGGEEEGSPHAKSTQAGANQKRRIADDHRTNDAKPLCRAEETQRGESRRGPTAVVRATFGLYRGLPLACALRNPSRPKGGNMRVKHLIIATAAVAVVGVTAVGCDNNDDGTLNQTWSINGSRDPSVCDRVRASQMRIVVFDPGLFVQATQFAPCRDFRTSLVLDENTYTASATFLDQNGVPISETRTITAFNVFEDAYTDVNVDFPLNAFFGP